MPRKNSKGLYIAALALFIAGIGYLLFSGFSGGSTYYIDVAEAMAMPQGKPASVRLFGKVKAEGLTSLNEGLGVRFQLEDKNNHTQAIWTTYKGAVPDAFVPGAEVIVEGTYMGAGQDFVAKKLMTQCPSKYQKKQQQG